MDKFINEDAILAVKRGIYWLDENHPGWETRIDLSELNMGACDKCVIGQAVGDYAQILDIRGDYREHTVWAIEHGFERPGVLAYTEEYSSTYNYSELDTLWSEEVRKRLG